MEKIIKVSLVVLMLLCLANMPYGFYLFVRLAALIGFGILAFEVNKEKQETMMFIYITLAILFQPIFKIPLGRTLWNIVDVLVAISLTASLFVNKRTNNNE